MNDLKTFVPKPRHAVNPMLNLPGAALLCNWDGAPMADKLDVACCNPLLSHSADSRYYRSWWIICCLDSGSDKKSKILLPIYCRI